jgi:hypothetical protein
MNAMKNIKQSKSFFSGSNTLNKIQDNDKAEILTDTLMLGSALKGGNITKINYVMQKISKFFPVDQTKMNKQGQEIMFNFFVNPKNTETNLKFIADLKNVKSQEDAINLMQSKYPELAGVFAKQSSRLTGQAMNAMSNPQSETQQPQLQRRTIDDIKRGFYEKKQNTDTDTRRQDILNRLRSKYRPQTNNTQQPTSNNQSQLINKFSNAESSGNINAKSTVDGSTSQGLYGFTDDTWRRAVNKFGKQYSVTLNDRNNREAQTAMALALTQDNKRIAKNKLGRDVNDTQAYALHFLGAGQGVKFIKILEKNPNGIAKNIFPNEAKYNKQIFYNDKKPRTIAEVYQILKKKVS